MLRLVLLELLLLTSFLHCVHGIIGRPQPQSQSLPQPQSQPQIPCFFIFGDSLSDSGNNIGLETDAKANFLPYGIDFPGGPTGRFTNGRTIIDLIGEMLGLENFIPPFSNASGQQILQGVNYASGTAGIYTETGKHVGGRIALAAQLKNHQQTVQKISKLLGKNNSVEHLNQCLYSTYIGNNDYILNYFGSRSSVKTEHSPEAFTKDLIDQYGRNLRDLYRFGARKILVFGLGPLGCLPLFQVTGRCNEDINNVANLFNSRLKTLLDQLNHVFPDVQFVFVNTYSIISPIPSSLGEGPCCGVGQIYCLPLSLPCKDRDRHAFWDNAHFTEATNKILATRAYKAQSPNDTYPMDISQLVHGSDQTIYSGGPVLKIRYKELTVMYFILLALVSIM